MCSLKLCSKELAISLMKISIRKVKLNYKYFLSKLQVSNISKQV